MVQTHTTIREILAGLEKAVAPKYEYLEPREFNREINSAVAQFMNERRNFNGSSDVKTTLKEKIQRYIEEVQKIGSPEYNSSMLEESGSGIRKALWTLGGLGAIAFLSQATNNSICSAYAVTESMHHNFVMPGTGYDMYLLAYIPEMISNYFNGETPRLNAS